MAQPPVHLPLEPYDGFIVVDSYGVRWVYNSELNGWKREGSVSAVPLADRTTVGLLSSADKRTLDTIPEKGGGFGLIVKPLLSVAGSGNPDGILFGDLEFVSDSLDLECIGGDGTPLDPKKCKIIGAIPDDAPAPGINFKVSRKFLNSLCFEIPGCAGQRGEKGVPGQQGKPGTGTGPAGEKGTPGRDATTAYTFTDVKTVDTDDISDTAVVGLELNAEGGILSITKSKVKTPSDDAPADQVVVSPIVRELEFTGNEFQYLIVKPPEDTLPTDDVTMLHYPKGFEPGGDVKEIDLNAGTLSSFVNVLTAHYRDELNKLAEKYDQQIRDHIVAKDNAARQQLNILAEELANCEFKLPIETCMGITPEDCGGGPPNTALAAFFFGDKYTGGVEAQDLGEYDVMPGGGRVQVIIKENGAHNFYSATLPNGDYLLQYVGGTAYDQNDPLVGYFVGLNNPDAGLKAFVTTPALGTVAVPFPETTEAYDRFDAASTESAYLNGPVLEKIVPVSLDPNGGEIALQTDAPSSKGTGVVKVRVVRFTEKAPILTEVTFVAGSGA